MADSEENFRRRPNQNDKSSSNTDSSSVGNGAQNNFQPNSYGNYNFMQQNFSNRSNFSSQSPDSHENSSTNTSGLNYPTMDAYCSAAQQWLWQYHTWRNSMHSFYSYLPYLASQATVSNGSMLPFPMQGQGAANTPNNIRNNVQTTQQPDNIQGTEYRCPQIWKRLVAEFIDFILLLLIKVFVTCLVVDYTGVTDLHPLNLDMIVPGSRDFDYDKMLSLTTEIMIMESINRIFISLFEALCLRHGIRTIGGSTPGKRLMGICVVSCTETIDLGDNRVRVIPAQNIGFWSALVRSVVKNFSMAFLFPLSFTALVFNHGRTVYDVIANSIVVETNDPIPQPF